MKINLKSLAYRLLMVTLVLQIAAGYVLFKVPSSHAASNGPRAGSVFSGNVAGAGTINWNNPDRVATSNSQWATASLVENEATSYLKVTGFGFSVPTTAIISGIQVNVEKHSDDTPFHIQRISDNSVRLVKNGTIVGSDKAAPGLWPTTDVVTGYGSSTDTWGLSLSPADVNDANFGFAISAKHDSDDHSRTASIDYISMSISYNVDTTSPVIAAHSDVFAEGTTLGGAVVNYVAPNATDNVDATAPAVCTPASNSTFSFGSTTVTCTKTDAAGNVAIPTTFKVKVQDTIAPTATISYSKTVGKVGDSLVIFATFSEAVADVPAPQITLSGAATLPATSMVKNGDQIHYYYTFSVPSGDGVVNVSVANAQDLAGHLMSSPATSSFLLDNTMPLVTGVTEGQISNTDLTINFSDANLLQASLDGSPASSPLPVSAEGNHTLVVMDQAGNTVTTHFTIDKTAPTATISYSKPSGTANAGDELAITATFSEPIADVPAPQIGLSGSANLALTNMTKVSDTQYSYTYIASSGDGLVNVSISGATDKAGNPMSSPATSSFNLATTPSLDITKTADNSGFVATYLTNLPSIFLQISDKADFSHLVKVVGQSTSYGPITITDLPKGVTYYFRLQGLQGTIATGYSQVKTGFISIPAIEPVAETTTIASENSQDETPVVTQPFAPTAKAAGESSDQNKEESGQSKDDQKNEGQVKSDSDKNDDNNNHRGRNILVVIALLAIAGAAYYGYKRLPETDEISEPIKTETPKNPLKPVPGKKSDKKKKK